MKHHIIICFAIFCCSVFLALGACSKTINLAKYSDQRSPNDEIVCVLKVSSEIHVKNLYDDDELTKLSETEDKFDSDVEQLTNNHFFVATDDQFGYIASFYPCDISLEFAESIANRYYHKNEITLEISSVDEYKKALSRLKPIDEEMQKYLDDAGFGKPQKED